MKYKQKKKLGIESFPSILFLFLFKKYIYKQEKEVITGLSSLLYLVPREFDKNIQVTTLLKKQST